MAKSIEKFESLDHYRGSDNWNEYRGFYDNRDGKEVEEDLKEFVCKEMSLDHNQRRALLKAISAPIE